MEQQKRPNPDRVPHRAQRKRPGARKALLLGGAALIALLVVILILVFGRDRGPTAPAELEIGTPAEAWQKNENGFYFNDRGEVILAATQKGIDVSKYQGRVDWQKAKEAGIDFAMIRCGYGSEWNGEGSYNQDDEYWEYNADECTRLGIPFGVYLYSYATTEEQARLEADHVARLLGLRAPEHEGLADYTHKPYKLSYPVYYDLEDKSITGLFPEEMANLTAIFFEQLRSYGYTGGEGIYASLNWTRARLTHPAFDPWRDNLWIARFNSTLGYTGPYSIWQSSYTVPGEEFGVESDTVDIDFIMEELSFTGIAEGQGKVAAPAFTNDTYKNELWLGQKGDKVTLLTDEPTEEEGGQRLFWTSSDEDVATVDKHGVVKAKADGSCTVTATTADGRLSAECLVRVGSVSIPIYATANLCGAAEDGEVSLADVAALKASNPDAILVDVGGSVQGSKNTSLTGGMDMTSSFSAAGYDLQAFDGRDLAFGLERLLEDTMTASGPSLAANLRSAEGTPLFYRSTSWSRNRITDGMHYIKQEAGKKIGFFALGSTGHYAHAAEMTANDPAKTAAEQVAALRAEGADAIVCLLGPDTDGTALVDTMTELGVQAVLTARADAPDRALFVPVDGGLNEVVELTLTFAQDGSITTQKNTWNADALVKARDSYSEAQQDAYEQTDDVLKSLAVGDAAVASQPLFTFAKNTGAERTILFGNYVAAVYEALADGDRAHWPAETADLPLVALAGGVTELEYGDITRGTLLESLPAGERLVLVRVANTAIGQLIDSGVVSRTYTESLIAYDRTEGDALLVTDTATLQMLGEQEYTVLRDYGDAFWNIRMNINDVTENFKSEFVLPEAPRTGAGRKDH